MSEATFRFAAPLWEHTGEAAWHFVTLPPDIADAIADMTASERRGFGSVRVTVTVGDTTWTTSVFPDSRAGTYLLPIKAAVRKAEALTAGDRLTADLTVRPA